MKGIKNKKRKKGFTMMEVMVSMVIIAILVSIAYPLYMKSVNKSRVVEATTLLSAVRTAEQGRLAKGKEYFKSFGELSEKEKMSLIKTKAKKGDEEGNIKLLGDDLKIKDYTLSLVNTEEDSKNELCIGATYKDKFTIYMPVETSGIWCSDEGRGMCKSMSGLAQEVGEGGSPCGDAIQLAKTGCDASTRPTLEKECCNISCVNGSWQQSCDACGSNPEPEPEPEPEPKKTCDPNEKPADDEEPCNELSAKLNNNIYKQLFNGGSIYQSFAVMNFTETIGSLNGPDLSKEVGEKLEPSTGTTVEIGEMVNISDKIKGKIDKFDKVDKVDISDKIGEIAGKIGKIGFKRRSYYCDETTGQWIAGEWDTSGCVTKKTCDPNKKPKDEAELCDTGLRTKLNSNSYKQLFNGGSTYQSFAVMNFTETIGSLNGPDLSKEAGEKFKPSTGITVEIGETDNKTGRIDNIRMEEPPMKRRSYYCDETTGEWVAGEWDTSECDTEEKECTGTKPKRTQTCETCGTQTCEVECNKRTGKWETINCSTCDKSKCCTKKTWSCEKIDENTYNNLHYTTSCLNKASVGFGGSGSSMQGLSCDTENETCKHEQPGERAGVDERDRQQHHNYLYKCTCTCSSGGGSGNNDGGGGRSPDIPSIDDDEGGSSSGFGFQQDKHDTFVK